MSEYAQKTDFKVAIKQRLINEGPERWKAFYKYRDFLKTQGFTPGDAWKIASFPFSPLDGSTPEIVADPQFAEIQANHKNGKYPEPPDYETFPNGATDFRAMKEPSPETTAAIEDVKKAPAKWKAAWQKLAAKVGFKNANELDEIRWVVANYLNDVSVIEAENVPSTAALAILSWAQESTSNFGDFLRTNYSKIIPDRKTIEYESRFKDDHRDLDLIEDFEASLATEESAA